MHWERDATVFTEKWEGGEENIVLRGKLGQRRACISGGGRDKASELHDLAQMSAPGVLLQI